MTWKKGEEENESIDEVLLANGQFGNTPGSVLIQEHMKNCYTQYAHLGC